jgi:hypothetical protein
MPPSERDFEVYRLTVVEGRSTRAAAEEMGLSQTRVMQIRERVCDWIATELPARDETTKEQRLRGAEYAAVQRLGYLYESACDAWRASCGPEIVQRQAGVMGDIVTTTRMSQGKTCYLSQAQRIAAQMAKWPQETLPVRAAEEEEPAEELPSESNEVPHPEEDCSADTVCEPEAACKPALLVEPTSSANERCDERANERSAELRSFPRPVQPSASAVPKYRANDAQETAPHPPLTRKDRRKRQRLLAAVQKRQEWRGVG